MSSRPRDAQGRFVKITGLAAIWDKLQQMSIDLHGPESESAMREATLLVQRDAKILSPVDTGRLRASILPRVTVRKFPPRVEGVVGSNVEYAPFQEERKGYLSGALDKNLQRIKELIGNFVARVVSR